MAEQESELDRLRQQLGTMELRLRRLEAAMSYSGTQVSVISEREAEPVSSVAGSAGAERGLETQIGRFGLAWMGNIVLLFGIVFLSQYLMNAGHRVFAVILGYAASAGIYIAAGNFMKSNGHLSFIFRMNAQVLFFYITMRLHFFSHPPLVETAAVATVLLLLVTVLVFVMAVRSRSQSLAGLAVIFSLFTAILSDSAVFIVPILLLTALSSVLLFMKYSWKGLLVFSITGTYLAFFSWVLGNPLPGHQVKVITTGDLGAVCLFSLGAIYSLIPYSRKESASEDGFLSGTAVVNGFLFTLMLLFVTVSFYSRAYVLLYSGISAACLVFSILLFRRSDWNFASAFYALYGFMALSIALFGLVGFPRVYLLLPLQSLLVVSMALWFRNRLIVIMNSLLFACILVAYLFTSGEDSGANFSFALVALVSARVINWQRSRLKIETDLIRNLYMIMGFCMMLIALYHSVPGQLITLSWTMAALLYFIISIILKNVKYRYMALGTMICSAIYLFVVDLARIGIVYRVLALLFLAAISIGISIYYTNRAGKHSERD